MIRNFLIAIFVLFIFIFDFYKLKFSNYYGFYSIPVLNDGRIKPIGTLIDYDYNFILQTDTSSNIRSFANLFFDPVVFFTEKKIEIKDNVIKTNLGLSEKNLFNLFELIDAFQKNSDLINSLIKTDFKTLDLSQKKLVNIYSEVSLILELSKCMDLVLLNKNIFDSFDGSVKNKYNFISNLENKNIKFDNLIIDFNLDLRILPSNENSWLKLNDFFKIKNYTNNLNMNVLNDIIELFNSKEISFWNKKCNDFKELSFKNMSKKDVILLKIEVFYNKLDLISKSCLFFLFCVFLIVFFKKIDLIMTLIWFSFAAGVSSLLFDLIFRIILTQKSPVTSLHESLIFVNFIFTFYFLIFFKNLRYILIISLASFFLSFVSIKLSSGGNIKPVVAVLNTNFWLIIHVLTISIGYGFCLISGFLSHLYLYQALKKNKLVLENLYNYIFYITLLALFFSFVGTLLGGIWADQSWGRFWGWDPKENGALLIVLWLTLILHAKFSNLISELYFVIGSILNLIVLALAWFGVNLLSVGLHSYGFIENIGFSLIIYIAFEFIFLIYFFLFYKKSYFNVY